MADIAGPRLAGDRGHDGRTAHRLRQQRGNVADGAVLAAADVEDTTGGARKIECKDEGLCDVLDMHEIAPLQTVFEDHWGLAVVQPGRKDRQYAGIGVR